LGIDGVLGVGLYYDENEIGLENEDSNLIKIVKNS
jgi:hypothetical protein